jgi:hypothetical protein
MNWSQRYASYSEITQSRINLHNLLYKHENEELDDDPSSHKALSDAFHKAYKLQIKYNLGKATPETNNLYSNYKKHKAISESIDDYQRTIDDEYYKTRKERFTPADIEELESHGFSSN